MVFILIFPVISNFHFSFERNKVEIHCHMLKPQLSTLEACRRAETHFNYFALWEMHSWHHGDESNGTDGVRLSWKSIQRDSIQQYQHAFAVRFDFVSYPLRTFRPTDMKMAILEPNSSQIAGNLPFIASFCRLACGTFIFIVWQVNAPRFPYSSRRMTTEDAFHFEKRTRSNMKAMILSVCAHSIL